MDINLNKLKFEYIFCIENIDDLDPESLDGDEDFDSIMKSEIEWCYKTEAINSVKMIKSNIKLCATENNNILLYLDNSLEGGLYECSLWISEKLRGQGIGKEVVREYINLNGRLSTESLSSSGFYTCIRSYKEIIIQKNNLSKEQKETLLSNAEDVERYFSNKKFSIHRI